MKIVNNQIVVLTIAKNKVQLINKNNKIPYSIKIIYKLVQNYSIKISKMLFLILIPPNKNNII